VFYPGQDVFAPSAEKKPSRMVGAPRRNASTSEEERSRHTVHDRRLAPMEGAKC
jgi:hypothetical protein